jgi:hypothetical protein
LESPHYRTALHLLLRLDRLFAIRKASNCPPKNDLHRGNIERRTFHYGTTEGPATLFEDALAMCKELRALDRGDHVAFWRAANRWRLDFKARVMPLKWELHPELILQKFKDRGVMELFTKCSDLS